MTDPWGNDQPAAVVGPLRPLPPRLARLAQVQTTGVALTNEDPYAERFPDAAELPEVQALIAQGWRPVHPAPLYSLLPAVWPPEHRTWVTDRLPRVGMGATTDTYWAEIVAVPDDDFETEHAADIARDAGLPPPPAVRIWLLRSPWPPLPVSVVYGLIWAVVDAGGEPDEIGQMHRVAGDVLAWDEARAIEACPPETRELLAVWAGNGRVGEAAHSVIRAGLSPDALSDATYRTGLDEADLLAWLTELDTDIETAIDLIIGWREAGLPDHPLPGAYRFADRDPHELRRWIEAGFNFYAAAKLELAGLDTTIRWRTAGLSAADTYDLLRADPDLTPDEAHTFDVLPAPERRRWVYYGFTAAQALEWSAAGLTAHQARLWRACGLHPASVPTGHRFPPQLVEGRRHIVFGGGADGELSNDEWDKLPDPPGTRGRRARRYRGDDDPWINTD